MKEIVGASKEDFLEPILCRDQKSQHDFCRPASGPICTMKQWNVGKVVLSIGHSLLSKRLQGIEMLNEGMSLPQEFVTFRML